MHRDGIVGCATKRLILLMFEDLFRSLCCFSRGDLETEEIVVVEGRQYRAYVDAEEALSLYSMIRDDVAQ